MKIVQDVNLSQPSQKALGILNDSKLEEEVRMQLPEGAKPTPKSTKMFGESGAAGSKARSRLGSAMHADQLFRQQSHENALKAKEGFVGGLVHSASNLLHIPSSD